MTTLPVLESMLEGRLGPRALEWYRAASAEIGAGLADDRFAALLALASRHARRSPIEPAEGETRAAGETLEGWNPERWNLLETLRAALVLSRGDLEADSGARAIEEGFRFADEGELCALYRVLAHLPAPERFAWRAGEGCRSNMVSVFEATALDTPYPVKCFDDLTWRQAVIKCIFIEAPLWRMWGLDLRLSDDLARMALDLADERRSAGRPVQHELWLCLGAEGGARALESIERELAGSSTIGRGAAAYALARAGESERLRALLAKETDGAVAASMRDALAGNTLQAAFRALDPRLRGTT